MVTHRNSEFLLEVCFEKKLYRWNKNLLSCIFFLKLTQGCVLEHRKVCDVIFDESVMDGLCRASMAALWATLVFG